MSYLEKARKVIELEVEELNRLLDRIGEPFERSVDVILEALEQRRKIIMLGVGKSGNIGHKIAATLNSTGATTVVLNAQNALHGDIGVVDEKDIVIALSYSGETAEVLSVIPFLKQFNTPIIAMTGKLDSSLARISDHVLNCGVEREACPLNLAPTSSSTVMLVMGDALAMVLLDARGFQPEDFATLHPGGNLGNVLTAVDEVMRKEIPRVAHKMPIGEVLSEMNRCRCGAAVIENADHSLAGIFTHGDFIRAFPEDSAISKKAVSTLMTPDPIIIHSGKLIADAIDVFKEHKIDDLIVVNAENRPVGLLDSQDLTRLRVS